jgi:hypothetical protein
VKISRIWSGLCPGGATGAQGFNPGNHPIKRIALKGREMIASLPCSVGRGAGWVGFPGLKPRAASYSPGAPNLPTFLNLAPFWPEGKAGRLTYAGRYRSISAAAIMIVGTIAPSSSPKGEMPFLPNAGARID